MSIPKVVQNVEGVNTILQRKKRSFAYFVFQNNTNPTVLTQNVWTQFSNPVGGLVEVIDNADEFTSDPNQLKITYTGTTPKFFNLSVVTNIFKEAGGGATRTIELQWYLNGVPVGFSREAQSNNESNIYTGNGMIFLQNGDEITPYVRNIENGDDVRVDNASFTLSEEIMHYYG